MREWIALREMRQQMAAMMPVPDGLTVGRPFRTLSAGAVRGRMDGEELGDITEDHLREMARLVVERAESDPVVIDWNHSSSPMFAASADPCNAASLGLIVGAFVADDERGPGLFVIPAYNERGLKAIADNAGALWSSPEFAVGDIFARDGDIKSRIGGAQLMAVALTNRPAQAASRIDAVALTEDITPGAVPDNGGLMSEQTTLDDAAPEMDALMEQAEEMEAMIKAKDEEIAGLLARIAELEADEDSDDEGEMLAAREAAHALTERVNAQAAEVKSLKEALGIERAERCKAEDAAEWQAFTSDGRVSPADRDNFMAALAERRAGRPLAWALAFADRKAGAAVPMGAAGHAHRDDSDPSAALHQKILAYAEKAGTDYNTAYNAVMQARH